MITAYFDDAHRHQLVEAIEAYGQRIGVSPAQKAATARLRDPRSVAVVTGQQAGLFTGPFYSISKALSAVGVARELERELERPVVAVFWVASEDHDFAEVDHAYFLSHQQTTQRVQLKHAFDSHQMVYSAPLDHSQVQHVLQVIQDDLPDHTYKAEMLQTLADCWQTGDSLAVWFARLMSVLLQNQPIVIVDPCLPALRQLVGPVFARTLQNFDVLQAKLQDAYDEVAEAGFEPEVIRDAAHSTVFHVVDGKRYVLERREDGHFTARGHGLDLDEAAWIRMAMEAPERFSSNVLLRPVIQDHLLPTLAYVGGPSEIAYHTLSRAVFHTHERLLPPLIMRQRFRIAGPGVTRAMKQWDISFEDVRQPVDLVATRLLQDFSSALSAKVTGMKELVHHQLSELADNFAVYGPQVAEMVGRQGKEHESLLTRLESKIYRLAEQRHIADVQQLRRIQHWFWTDGHEQERRLCPLNVWAELGLVWFESLPAWGNYRQPAKWISWFRHR